jgi:hypothetical protein
MSLMDALKMVAPATVELIGPINAWPAAVLAAAVLAKPRTCSPRLWSLDAVLDDDHVGPVEGELDPGMRRVIRAVTALSQSLPSREVGMWRSRVPLAGGWFEKGSCVVMADARTACPLRPDGGGSRSRAFLPSP